MDGIIGGRHSAKFSLAAIVLGAVLVISAAISGTTMLIAFYKGITQIHTLSDIRVNVMRVLFSVILPLAGGITLAVAGVEIMRFSTDSVQKRTAKVNGEKARKEKARVIDLLLSKDEKYVLDLAGTKADGVLQSDIALRSGFSKVKTHRILKKLENKDLVRRARFGITNRVVVVRH